MHDRPWDFSMHEIKVLRAPNSDKAGLKCQIYHFLVKKPRINNAISLCHTFNIYKMGMETVTTFQVT